MLTTFICAFVSCSTVRKGRAWWSTPLFSS